MTIRPVLVGALAAAVAGFDVTVPGVWRDEAASITAAERSWSAFGGLIARIDAVHALFYALLHLWFAAVGYSPLALRLPSVLAAGVGAGLVVVLGDRLAGRRAGTAAGLVAAVLPSLVWAGGEGRSYAWTALLATAATLALLHALDAPHSLLRWVAYAALLALGTVLFVDVLLLGLAHLVAVLLLRRGRAAATISVAAATAATSPLLLLAAHQAGQLAWISRFGVPTGWDVPVDQWFRSSYAAAVAAASVLVVGSAVAALRRRPPRRPLAVLVPWALLPPAVLLAVGVVHAPVYWPRYVTFTAPAVALLVGVAAAALPRPLTAVAVLVVAALAVPQIALDRGPDAKSDAAMRDGAELLARERSTSDGASGILYSAYLDVPHATTRIDAIAYPAAFRGLQDLRAVVPLDRSTALFGADRSMAAAAARAGRLRTVWVLLTTTSDAPVAQLTSLGFHASGRFTTTDTVLLRFTR